MIKAILFDFYGVFLPDAYETWLRSNGLQREGVFAELVEKNDKGDISESEFLAGLSQTLGRTVRRDEIHLENSVADAEVVALARSLRQQYKVCLFSNASTKLRGRLHRLDIIDLFDEVIVSGEIGYAKPSDTAFTIAIDRVGVQSNEIFFTDDKPINVEAARKNNMRAGVFTSVDELRQTIDVFDN